MKIALDLNGKVILRFTGKVNMSQEVILSKEDARKLGEMLLGNAAAEMETTD